MRDDPICQFLNISPAFIAEKAAWLAEERNLISYSLVYFRDAGKLVALSSYEHRLFHLGFFMAILGVERALKLHFRDDETPLKQLLQKAVTEGWISDSIFQRIEPLGKSLLALVDKDQRKASYSQKLVSLIPALRNQFFHGNYYSSPEFFWLTLQLREISDELQTYEFPRIRSLPAHRQPRP